MLRLLLLIAVLAGGYFLIREWHRLGWNAQGQRLAFAAGAIALLWLMIRGSVGIPLLVLAVVLVRGLMHKLRTPPSPSSDHATPVQLDSATLSRAEAYQILGLPPDASRGEVQQAYRRLIQRVHPDHGGSAYLAARLNQARELLLG